MLLTDTHIHLYADEFSGTLDVLMREAIRKDIKRFFIPNIDSSSMQLMFDICHAYPQHCFPCAGLHPCYVKENYVNELDLIMTQAEHEKIFAVGEIGMDLYWDKTFVKEQEEAFVMQLQWANQLNLPVLIHSRESTAEIIHILEIHQALKPRGIFHCFSGNLQQANQIIELGFLLGIGGVLTFKNAGLDKIIEQVDLKHIVLETDAPYLAPVPHRGKRNEPAFLFLIAEKLAALKGKRMEERTKDFFP